jgi:RHS repeat-associated protein
LTNMLGSVVSNFKYDGLGRRIERTVASTTEKYLYDGLDIIIQKDSAGNVRGRYFRGLAIDEPWQRIDITPAQGNQTTTTNRIYLADALGSIVALTDTNKVIQTEYDYQPFGATSMTGASNKNAYKFTAREDDSTGLYYYRARYYHPALGRFVSEDPFWMIDGPNMYAYARNSPLIWSDPSGLAGIDDLIRRYLLNQVKIGAGIGIAEIGVQLATCALLQRGQTATIRSPVSQVLTVALFPILASQGGYIILLEVTKTGCGATDCEFRYIAVPIGNNQGNTA